MLFNCIFDIFILFWVFIGCASDQENLVATPTNPREITKIVCYYDSRYVELYNFNVPAPKHIDPTLCTHIIYAFGKITNQSKVSVKMNYAYIEDIEPLIENLNVVEKTVALKKKNKDLKVLLSVGGWTFNSEEFQRIVADSTTRHVFISSILEILAKYQFDGLDIYPENPANRGDIIYQESKEYLIVLCQELKRAFAPFNYILTAALPGNLKAVPGSSQVMIQLAELLDFITIIAYDLHGAWENVTVHHAPLYTHPNANEKEKPTSIDDVVQQWLRTGISRDKLLLGLSSHGRSFVIKDQNEKCPLMNTPILCASPPELFTFTSGLMSYGEVCLNLKLKWTYKYLEDQKVPFAFSTPNEEMFYQWIGFDDVRSFDAKVKYLMDARLGGATLFSLDNEDFRHYCRQKPFPLLRVINYYLNPKLKVEYPDPDIPFNLTQAKIQSAEKENNLKKYFKSFNQSANNTEAIALFCHCKKGVDSVQVGKQLDGTNSSIMIDCDNQQILIPEQKAEMMNVSESNRNENQYFIDSMTKKQHQRSSLESRILLGTNTSYDLKLQFFVLIISITSAFATLRDFLCIFF